MIHFDPTVEKNFTSANLSSSNFKPITHITRQVRLVLHWNTYPRQAKEVSQESNFLARNTKTLCSMSESQPEEVVVAEPKISRKLFEEVLRASETLDSKLEVTLRSVRTSDSSEIASLTWSPTTFTLNKTDANSAAHVSSGLHQSISSQDPATVFALSEFYESVRENNKVVVRA